MLTHRASRPMPGEATSLARGQSSIPLNRTSLARKKLRIDWDLKRIGERIRL
jgi:hypothetical protein